MASDDLDSGVDEFGSPFVVLPKYVTELEKKMNPFL